MRNSCGCHFTFSLKYTLLHVLLFIKMYSPFLYCVIKERYFLCDYPIINDVIFGIWLEKFRCFFVICIFHFVWMQWDEWIIFFSLSGIQEAWGMRICYKVIMWNMGGLYFCAISLCTKPSLLLIAQSTKTSFTFTTLNTSLNLSRSPPPLLCG